jgi:sulfite reductase (ferredoxin)
MKTEAHTEVRFYELPPKLAEELGSFEQSIASFLRGEMDPIRFRAIRVPFGVYEQRKGNTYMIRIRATAGGVTPRQLAHLGRLAQMYGGGFLHLTTRQEVQIHDVRPENILNVVRSLPEVGLSSRGGGGNTIRNITADSDTVLFDGEAFDVTPWAVALSSRLIAEDDSWTLPRKLKINFSSDEEDRGQAQFSDLGFIAAKLGHTFGFHVYVAGGMGARSAVGKRLYDFVEAPDIHAVARGVKNFFNRHGNRKNKFRNRIRFLYDDLGGPEFMRLLQQEIESVRGENPPPLEPLHFRVNDTTPNLEKSIDDSPEYRRWFERTVRIQNDGRLRVRLALPLGDIDANDAIRLANFLANFGEDTMRISIQQNLHIRNIPAEYAPNLYAILRDVSLLADADEIIANGISCTGADTCKLGITLPRNITKLLQRRLIESDLDLNGLGGLRLNISGCPNSCGQHVIADLGFYGRAFRKNGRLYPGYNIVAGGIIREGRARLAKKAGEISAKDLPDFVVEFLGHYLEKRDRYDGFASYIDGEGTDDIARIAASYNQRVPEFETDRSYYIDAGSEAIFSMAERGEGECSAGIFDLIDSDRKIIQERERAFDAEEGLSIADLAKRARLNRALFEELSASARMLLVTRGSEPTDPDTIFLEFKRLFIESGLVPLKFAGLIDAGREYLKRPSTDLSSNQEGIRELARSVERLYESMDANFQFTSPGAKAIETEKKN